MKNRHMVRGDSMEISALWAQRILQDMPVLMDAFDSDDRIVVWNTECERVTGYSADEMIGNTRALEILYPDTEYRTLMMEEQARHRGESHSRVWELMAKDRSRKAIEWFNLGARIHVPGWSQWAIGVDITERLRLETALQEATTREQRRIAREMHDGLGQELSGLSMLASGLAVQPAVQDATLERDLRQLAELARRSVETCRLLACGLAPLQDHQNSLAAALRRLAIDNTNRVGGPTVVFAEEASAASNLSEEATNHLYRIVQEALNNALKHSAANTVTVQLIVNRTKVTICVIDDGRGLGTTPRHSHGMGMQTMRDRASAIGGRLSITPNSPTGTVIRCECRNRKSPISSI